MFGFNSNGFSFYVWNAILLLCAQNPPLPPVKNQDTRLLTPWLLTPASTFNTTNIPPLTLVQARTPVCSPPAQHASYQGMISHIQPFTQDSLSIYSVLFNSNVHITLSRHLLSSGWCWTINILIHFTSIPRLPM